VHPAVISGYNEATHSVTVEWFENDETKGKEIDVRHVMSLKENQPSNKATPLPFYPLFPESRLPVRHLSSQLADCRSCATVVS